MLSCAKERITISDFETAHPVYECITPLRHLLLKRTNPHESGPSQRRLMPRVEIFTGAPIRHDFLFSRKSRNLNSFF